MSRLGNAGAALAFATMSLFSSTALADDWTAVKLRGVVVGLFDGEWVKLQRGAVIPEDQPIRTLASGRVTFERGEETIDLGPNTQVQIFDRAGRKHTTVKQHFGRVAVEAEVRDVTHFSVQTPHLAAVVKGTRFVVISDDQGARVQVERGAVAVKDSADSSAVIVAGQEATSTPGSVMTVAGRGELPQVLDAKGKPVDARAAEGHDSRAGETDPRAEEAPNNAGGAASGNGKSNNGGGSSGGGGGNAGSGNGSGGDNAGSGNSGSGGGNTGSSNSGSGGGNTGGSNSGGGGGGNGGSNSGSSNSGGGDSSGNPGGSSSSSGKGRN